MTKLLFIFVERGKWGSFVIYCLFMSMFVYPIFGNWVWGGGWLSQLGTQFGLGHGHVDFAGSSVVHLVGGVAAKAAKPSKVFQSKVSKSAALHIYRRAAAVLSAPMTYRRGRSL